MSSLLRTMTKRIMRNKLGYQREKSFVTTDLAGFPKIVEHPRGKGPIVDAEGERVSAEGSSFYPRALPPMSY